MYNRPAWLQGRAGMLQPVLPLDFSIQTAGVSLKARMASSGRVSSLVKPYMSIPVTGPDS